MQLGGDFGVGGLAGVDLVDMIRRRHRSRRSRASSRRVHRQRDGRYSPASLRHLRASVVRRGRWSPRMKNDQGLGEAEHVDEPYRSRCVVVTREPGQAVGAGVSVMAFSLDRRRRCRLGGMGSSSTIHVRGEHPASVRPRCLNGPGRNSHIRQRARLDRDVHDAAAPGALEPQGRAACLGAKPISSLNQWPKCLLLQPISSARSAMGTRPPVPSISRQASPAPRRPTAVPGSLRRQHVIQCRTVQTRSASTQAGRQLCQRGPADHPVRRRDR